MSNLNKFLIIDCQSHIFPEPYREILLKTKSGIKALYRENNLCVTFENSSLLLDFNRFDLKKKIYDMDKNEIDVSVISCNIPGPELLEEEMGIKSAKLINDYIAEVCEKYRGRIYGIASLPMQNVNEAIAEIKRAVNHLKLVGVIIYSNIRGKPIDASEFEPIYELLEKLDIPIVIHPTFPSWSEVIKDYSMVPMLGFILDHSIAMLRLILSGILERYPDLKILHPHCGGILPYIMPRIIEQTEVKRRGRENISKSPDYYYKRVYLDIVSPSAEVINFVKEIWGSKKLLFGSDHPWHDHAVILSKLSNLYISREEKENILGLNAIRLFKLAR